MVKWYHKSLPSLRCGFDSRYPLQISSDHSISEFIAIRRILISNLVQELGVELTLPAPVITRLNRSNDRQHAYNIPVIKPPQDQA